MTGRVKRAVHLYTALWGPGQTTTRVTRVRLDQKLRTSLVGMTVPEMNDYYRQLSKLRKEWEADGHDAEAEAGDESAGLPDPD